ncbi:Glutathione synthetase, putative [Giardia lamblia P15]|uniref:glutathione synthase n=1 Tax=Giardia intestinalis (strain P15) TaxID=658858 RepID=E1EZT0_GIAIA|nr:Glutathione synthetase, putative [Giardia lamblia P15]
MDSKTNASTKLRQRAIEADILFASSNDSLVMVPIASEPYTVSRNVCNDIMAKTELLGRFIADAALDSDLVEAAANRCLSDKVCNALWRIVLQKKTILGQDYVAVLRASTAILQRTDFYVVNQSPRLIEINTISVGLLGMSARLADIQASCGHLGVMQSNLASLYSSLAHIAVERDTMSSVWLMVVSEEEPLFTDQLAISQGYNSYCKAHGVPSTMIRSTCKELAEAVHVQGEKLVYSHGSTHLRIAGAYWRTGYECEHCTSSYEQLRILLETHSLVSIPTAEAQLVGMKAVQNMLPTLAVTSRYTYLSGITSVLSKILDSPQAISAWLTSSSDTNAMVLKSVAEGGGNCVFGDDIPIVWDALLRTGSEAASTHFLMERLVPDSQDAVQFIYSNRIVNVARVDAEVGVYSFCRPSETGAGSVQLVHYLGFLVRMKEAGAGEGGILHGQGVLACLKVQ